MAEMNDYDTERSTLTFNTTTTESPVSAPSIDTIIVIIWAIGGALLITLIVLMVCILRSHQKGRRNRTNGPQGRGNPRHGGVNHGFNTNYDEVWQWIPVINGSQARCPSQRNPSALGSSSQQQNSANQQRTLLNNLRLPSYNEAVRNTGSAQNNNTTNQSRSNQVPLPGHVVNTGSVVPMTNRPEARTQQRVLQTRLTNNTSASPEHHYETIPVDRIPTSRQTGHSYTANHVTSVSVTSSSGVPINRAGARVSIDQMSRAGNSRLPPVPSPQSPRPNRLADNRIISGNVCPSANSHQTRAQSSNIYPIMDNITAHQAFQHSTSSVFTYCGNHGNQRVFSDIPPSVPSVYEAPTLQTRGVAGTGNQRVDIRAEPSTSLSQNTRDALRRLESEYF